MRDYVKMFILSETPKYYTLVSEGLYEDEIQEFAEAFQHNYSGQMQIIETKAKPNYTLIASEIPKYLFRGTFQPQLDCFIVATCKYINRGDKLKKQK